MYDTIAAIATRHDVTLVAVSKTRHLEDIRALYNKGQRDFGENRVQELIPKHDALPSDIRWHLIGHLQTNKVRSIAPFIYMIQSVDSLSLLMTIEKEAKRCQRQIHVLLQFHIAREETKYGMSEDEAFALLAHIHDDPLSHVIISGVMGMASFTDDMEQVRREFATLAALFAKIKTAFFADDDQFQHISMGMSGDYPIAIEEGATLIRVGSALFAS